MEAIMLTRIQFIRRFYFVNPTLALFIVLSTLLSHPALAENYQRFVDKCSVPQKLEIYVNNAINGIAVYCRYDGKKVTKYGSPNGKKHVLEFNSNERITGLTAIRVGISNGIENTQTMALQIHTDQRSSPIIGNLNAPGGETIDLRVADGYRFRGFTVYVGQYIHKIGYMEDKGSW